MIGPGGRPLMIYLATRPVDFRKVRSVFAPITKSHPGETSPTIPSLQFVVPRIVRQES